MSKFKPSVSDIPVLDKWLTGHNARWLWTRESDGTKPCVQGWLVNGATVLVSFYVPRNGIDGGWGIATEPNTIDIPEDSRRDRSADRNVAVKTCEAGLGGKLCGKRALFRSNSAKAEYLCENCHHFFGDVLADSYYCRMPLDAEMLAVLLDQEFTKADAGIAMVAGSLAPSCEEDEAYKAKTQATLQRICDRWQKGDL